MGDLTTENGAIRMEVNHHEYAYIASAFAVKDFEYIRKRINANRNLRNKILTSTAGRTYESMKTLIDVMEIIAESGCDVFAVVPIKTVATIDEEKFAEVVSTGKFMFNADDLSDDFVEYKITATFSRYPSGKEVYTVVYDLSWDSVSSPSGTPGSISWTDVYPVTGNDVTDEPILGYSENFPAPSVIAGKIAENLLVTVKEIWREDEEGGESDGSGMDESSDKEG